MESQRFVVTFDEGEKPGCSTRSGSGVNQFGEHVASDKGACPFAVVLFRQFGSYNFIEGFPLFLHRGDAVVNGYQHIAVFGHFRFSADLAVSGNDDGFFGESGQVRLGCQANQLGLTPGR